MSAVTELQTRFDCMKKAGLSDMKFYPGEVSDSTPESFSVEALVMLDAIDAGETTPLTLEDSRRV